MKTNRITLVSLALLSWLAFGCAGSDSTTLSAAPDVSDDAQALPPVGVGEVNGLPGTPLAVSPRGIPIIEGIERPDYAEDGINSWQKRWERKTDENPTGEYRFQLDETDPDEWIADADDRAGFRNGLEEYTWKLTHPNYVGDKGIFLSAVYHGKAFSKDSAGTISARGACWMPSNAGFDCEFPDSLKKTWRLAFGNLAGDEYSTCSQLPPNGTLAPTFFQDPSAWIQEGFDKWKPEAVMTRVTAQNSEKITVYCQPMPGSPFGAILGRSGGFGATTRRVTNAKDAYPGGSCAGNAFPKGLYTYTSGEVQYSADNLAQRALLCGTDPNDPDNLHVASVNMFMHEMGHFLGFAHFATGVMQTGGDCGLFYSQFRTVPTAFHQALAAYSPVSGTFHFIGNQCDTPTILPVPTANSDQFPFGRLFQ